MPKISQHSYDIAVVAVRRDHTSGVSVLKVYRPCPSMFIDFITKVSDIIAQTNDDFSHDHFKL